MSKLNFDEGHPCRKILGEKDSTLVENLLQKGEYNEASLLCQDVWKRENRKFKLSGSKENSDNMVELYKFQNSIDLLDVFTTKDEYD